MSHYSSLKVTVNDENEQKEVECFMVWNFYGMGEIKGRDGLFLGVKWHF